jgi:hypothetical protein
MGQPAEERDPVERHLARSILALGTVILLAAFGAGRSGRGAVPDWVTPVVGLSC